MENLTNHILLSGNGNFWITAAAAGGRREREKEGEGVVCDEKGRTGAGCER
jgi:hypothetical protein